MRIYIDHRPIPQLVIEAETAVEGVQIAKLELNLKGLGSDVELLNPARLFVSLQIPKKGV